MLRGLSDHVGRWQRWQMVLVCVAGIANATIGSGVLIERDRARVVAGITARLHGASPRDRIALGIEHRYHSFSGPVTGGVMRVEHVWMRYPAWVKPLILFSLFVPPLALRTLWVQGRRRQHAPPPA